MSDNATAADAAQAALNSLHEEARRHKRASAHHRREARRIMELRAELHERCRIAGIEIIIESTTPEA